MTAQEPPTPPLVRPMKQVEHDPITGDYAFFLHGQLIGYAPTEAQAWERINSIVYTLLTKNPVAALLPHERTHTHDNDTEYQHELGA